MIFVSSSCVRNQSIKDSVLELVEVGFKNIELSGGTELYPDLVEDLLDLKVKFNLTYRCHNYFPPPESPFVLNLASLNEYIFRLSYDHVAKAIKLSEQLGCDKYGIHAGFLINIEASEVGKSIRQKELFDRGRSVSRFVEAVGQLSQLSSIVTLYIENNVISNQNYKNYQGANPLLLTSYSEFLDLRSLLQFNLLLDIAHLKVSAQTLGLKLKDELKNMLSVSDYIHISDNDGTRDSNHLLNKNEEVYDLLWENKRELAGKDFTLEVYSGKEDIIKSYRNLESLL